MQAKLYLVYKVASDLPYSGGLLLAVAQSLVLNYVMSGPRTVLGVSCLPHNGVIPFKSIILSCIAGVTIVDL